MNLNLSLTINLKKAQILNFYTLAIAKKNFLYTMKFRATHNKSPLFMESGFKFSRRNSFARVKLETITKFSNKSVMSIQLYPKFKEAANFFLMILKKP